MKLLIKNGVMAGGAPRSLLEYGKVAKGDGYQVCCAGEFRDAEILYQQSGIETFNIPNYTRANFLKNILILFKDLRLVGQLKPDLIQVVTPEQCWYYKVISFITGIPVVYMQAGGEIEYVFKKLFAGDRVVVFSNENKVELIKHGFDQEKIIVITNRVNFNDALMPERHFYRNQVKQINLLLISRIDKTNQDSVKLVINIFFELIKMDNVVLRILGNGNLFDEFKQRYKHEKLQWLGFQKDVSSYIKESHLVFGKGRSIIDAIYNGKFSIVMNEEYNFKICTENNLQDMIDFNLAGRNISNSDRIADIEELNATIRKGKVDSLELSAMQEIIKENYDIKKGKEKISRIYSLDYICRKSYMKAIITYFKIIIYYFSWKILKR